MDEKWKMTTALVWKIGMTLHQAQGRAQSLFTFQKCPHSQGLMFIVVALDSYNGWSQWQEYKYINVSYYNVQVCTNILEWTVCTDRLYGRETDQGRLMIRKYMNWWNTFVNLHIICIVCSNWQVILNLWIKCCVIPVINIHYSLEYVGVLYVAKLQDRTL